MGLCLTLKKGDAFFVDDTEYTVIERDKQVVVIGDGNSRINLRRSSSMRLEDGVTVVYHRWSGNKCTLMFNAPRSKRIWRAEIYERMKA